MEALLVAGNSFDSFEGHQQFIHYLMNPVAQEWTSDVMTAVCPQLSFSLSHDALLTQTVLTDAG